MGSSVDSLAKTKDAVKLLAALGAQADTDKCADSKKLRAGKGKMRNRRYVGRKGPLLVHAGAEQLPRAMRNLPGVDLCHVDRLNLLLLAPKKNPLKNLEAMLALNPYQQVVRDNEMKAQKTKKPKYAKQDKARRAASTAFYNAARLEGEVTL